MGPSGISVHPASRDAGPQRLPARRPRGEARPAGGRLTRTEVMATPAHEPVTASTRRLLQRASEARAPDGQRHLEGARGGEADREAPARSSGRSRGFIPQGAPRASGATRGGRGTAVELQIEKRRLRRVRGRRSGSAAGARSRSGIKEAVDMTKAIDDARDGRVHRGTGHTLRGVAVRPRAASAHAAVQARPQARRDAPRRGAPRPVVGWRGGVRSVGRSFELSQFESFMTEARATRLDGRDQGEGEQDHHEHQRPADPRRRAGRPAQLRPDHPRLHPQRPERLGLHGEAGIEDTSSLMDELLLDVPGPAEQARAAAVRQDRRRAGRSWRSA